MEPIVIVGAGGFGREVQWLIERINSKEKEWEILGYIDDNLSTKEVINGYPILGKLDWFQKQERKLNVVCAIGSPLIRKEVLSKLQNYSEIEYPNLIDPSIEFFERVSIGIGNIICANNLLTVDIILKDFNIINLDCTIGHDVEINSYVTLYPGANISGNVVLEDGVEIGTGACIIQGKKIGRNTIVGAGAVVINNLPEKCVAVGNPAKVIKSGRNIK